VQGVGGGGKTALLRAFTGVRHGVRLAWATGDEAEIGLPYGVLDELRGQLRGAAEVVDAPREPVGPRDPLVEGAAFLAAVDGAPGSGPLVLVVDDAHLADGPSLAALTFALRRLRTDPVLAVLAIREDGLVRLPPGLLRLISDRGARVTLSGLSTPEVVEMGQAVGYGQMSTRAAARLREHTGGQPLHLRALMTELRLDQVEALDVPLPVPRSLAKLVLATLGELSRPAQRLAGPRPCSGPGRCWVTSRRWPRSATRCPAWSSCNVRLLS